jgi:hypothetical protein
MEAGQGFGFDPVIGQRPPRQPLEQAVPLP